jgi:hypothetical protein
MIKIQENFCKKWCHVVSNMQNIQDEAKEGIKKIGFV